MNTKTIVALLSVCLSLMSSCSNTSIPISNEQISKDILNKKNVSIIKDGVFQTNVNFTTGKNLKDPSGNEYHHCFKVTSSDFSQGTGQIEITLFSTGMALLRQLANGTMISHTTHIQTSSGKVKLLYDKKGDGWIFKDLSLIDNDASPFLVRDIFEPDMKLTVGVSKPLCDVFDSSNVKKQAK
jgi:hypothetical protein